MKADIKIQVNKLEALEKAARKAEKAINLYNSSMQLQHATRIYHSNYERDYFNRAANLLKKARKEHEAILTALWDKGIFV